VSSEYQPEFRQRQPGAAISIMNSSELRPYGAQTAAASGATERSGWLRRRSGALAGKEGVGQLIQASASSIAPSLSFRESARMFIKLVCTAP
jgi:hypothetical protein